MDKQVLEKMAAHLEFLGYQIENKGESVFATHPQKTNILIRPGSGGFFIQALYNVGKKAEQDRIGFLEALNELNSKAIVARFWAQPRDKEPSLGIDVWVPSIYDKVAFGTFLEFWHYDTVTLLYQNELIKEFF